MLFGALDALWTSQKHGTSVEPAGCSQQAGGGAFFVFDYVRPSAISLAEMSNGRSGAFGVTGTVWGGKRAEAGPAKGKSGHAPEDQDALDLAADWADICQGLKKDLGPQLFNQWIRPIHLGAFNKESGTLELFLPTEFSANWVADRFADRLTLAWKIARDVRHVRISAQPGRRAMPDLRLARQHPLAPRAGFERSQPCDGPRHRRRKRRHRYAGAGLDRA